MKLCENQNKVQRPGQQEDFLNSPAPFSSLSSTFPSSCCVFSSCRDSPLHSERSSTRSSSPSASSVCWSPSWPCRRTSWWCRAGSGRAAAAGSSLQREEQKKCAKILSRTLWALKRLQTARDELWHAACVCLKPQFAPVRKMKSSKSDCHKTVWRSKVKVALVLIFLLANNLIVKHLQALILKHNLY